MFESLKSPRFQVQTPFLQQARGRFGKLGFRLLLVLVPLFFLRACVLTYVPPGRSGCARSPTAPARGCRRSR